MGNKIFGILVIIFGILFISMFISEGPITIIKEIFSVYINDTIITNAKNILGLLINDIYEGFTKKNELPILAINTATAKTYSLMDFRF